MSLGFIFAYIVAPPGLLVPALRAYGSVNVFHTKIGMIKEAAAVYLALSENNLVKNDLSDFLNLCEQYSTRRNEIAHGVVVSYDTELFFHESTKKGYVLAPTYHNTRKQTFVPNQTASIPDFIYSSVEIDYFTERFMDLLKQTDELSKRIEASNPHRLLYDVIEKMGEGFEEKHKNN